MFDSWCQGLCHGGFDMSIYYWEVLVSGKETAAKRPARHYSPITSLDFPKDPHPLLCLVSNLRRIPDRSTSHLFTK